MNGGAHSGTPIAAVGNADFSLPTLAVFTALKRMSQSVPFTTVHMPFVMKCTPHWHTQQLPLIIAPHTPRSPRLSDTHNHPKHSKNMWDLHTSVHVWQRKSVTSSYEIALIKQELAANTACHQPLQDCAYRKIITIVCCRC